MCARRDWRPVRAGVLEVVLTLAATIGFGFAWAALESAWLGLPSPGQALLGSLVGPESFGRERLGPERPITAAAIETGYAAPLASNR